MLYLLFHREILVYHNLSTSQLPYLFLEHWILNVYLDQLILFCFWKFFRFSVHTGRSTKCLETTLATCFWTKQRRYTLELNIKCKNSSETQCNSNTIKIQRNWKAFINIEKCLKFWWRICIPETDFGFLQLLLVIGCLASHFT